MSEFLNPENLIVIGDFYLQMFELCKRSNFRTDE